ncbi:Heat shock protein DnaJ domain protein [Methylocella tundrae]|uniref:Heat shock protein DnaJ domain protein n=2 Tax=Methylocella tundrae TaxID=227605 RepID=A0A8B6MCX6_METTU|nr:Heat shock protein DnaJ domain protein [Methylocella tundrae]
MNLGMILSSAALGVSVVVSAFKFVDWLLHSDARTLVRTARWSLFAAAAASVPGLIALLAYRQWTLAMLLGAGMLAVPAAINWRAFIPRRPFRPMWSETYPQDEMRGDFGQPPPDPELARRAAIILEDYLKHAGHPEISARIDSRRPPAAAEDGSPRGDGPMGSEEALDVLGLEAGATAAAVRAAHRRLMQVVHPDRGGSNYLAAKINRAKDALLTEAARKPRAATRRMREPSKRATGGDADGRA